MSNSITLYPREVLHLLSNHAIQLWRPMDPQPDDSFLIYHDGGTVSPYGQVGSELWVKEAWSAHQFKGMAGGEEYTEFPNVIYYADNTTRLITRKDVWDYVSEKFRWQSASDMPRWVSRLSLEIESVSISRPQDITHGQAVKCGFPCYHENYQCAVEDFREDWEKTHGIPVPVSEGGSVVYHAFPLNYTLYYAEPIEVYPNPWSWVIDVRVIK